MIHLAGTAVADSQRGQLVIGPESPIEQQQVHASETIEQRHRPSSPQPGTYAHDAAAALVEEAQSHRVAGCVHLREPWWSGGHFEGLDHNAAGLSIAISERDPCAQRHLVNVDSGKRLSEGKDPGVLFQYQSHRRSGEELEMASLPQEHDSQRVVQLGVRDDDAFDRHMANARWNGTRKAVQLFMDIR